MRHIRSISDLQGALDDGLAWRLRDLHGLKKAIRGADEAAKNAAMRAQVAMLYAHWEGFVRGASTNYASYLSQRNLNYGDVLDCFRGLQAIRYVRDSETVRRRLFAPNSLLKRLREMDKERLHIPLDKHIGQVGNLNFDLFSDILDLLGLNPASYEPKRMLIDERLLRQRNIIAHGSHLMVDEDSIEDLANEIIGLMRGFKSDIELAATSKSYLRT